MDKSREVRSSSVVVASNGSSRRRNRATIFRDLPEEGQVELQETVRLRERPSKRDRDRDFTSRSKRRRGGSHREEELEEEEEDEAEAGMSAEDTVADGDSNEVEDAGGVSRILSSTTASSASNQNQRRNSLPPRIAKQQWKVVDDAMIGVPVPRKARSASVKRSYDCAVSGNSGVGGAGEDLTDDQSHRNPSDSPARSSAEVVSPSTSMISIKKKMKPTGPKTRTPKTSKGSSPSAKEGDIEIEIAEVLYGLMKQTQCSKKEDGNGKPSPNPETEKSGVIRDNTKSSVTFTAANSVQNVFQKSGFHQNNGAISDLLLSVAEKNKPVIDGSTSHAQNDSSDGAVKRESEQPEEMEICPPKLELAPDFNMNICSHECQTVVTEPEETKPAKDVSISGEEITGSKKTLLTQEELPGCGKADVNLADSLPTKSIPEAEIQKEEKLKIDLMAPPTSPERDGLAEEEKGTSNNVENEGGFKEKEKRIDEIEDKSVTSGKKLEFLKLESEKPHFDGIKKQEQSQKQQSKGTAGTVEKIESLTSVRLPISLGGWPPAEISSTVGYMPTFQTAVSMVGVDKASTKVQHPNFILSYPRPKRCLTHYDIARNIYLHQQFTKTNYFQPAVDASASLADAKLKNISSSESMILCNPLHGNHLDVNIHSVQQKGHAAADFPGHAVNDKSPEAANFFGLAKNKQLVFQQGQGASFGDSVSGSGIIFPISQHQAPIAKTVNQSGSTKSSNSATSLLNNPEAGSLKSFPALPAVSGNVSYSHPNLVSIEAPYFAKLQNNSYLFPFPAPDGTTTTYRANPAQALPLFNGPFFSSQVQPPQTLSQSQSHHVVPSIHQSGGSLSHKHSQTQQQQWSVHVPGNNLLPSNSMQVKQSMEQHLSLSNQSRKHESETSGEDTASLSDTRTPQVQKNVYGQNFILPVQALNFTLMPSATFSNGNGGNHGEKKQSHPQNLKSAVALVPSQALTMSFASFGGSSTSSNLSFAPMAQNTTVFHGLPDIQKAGFQVASAPQATKQKNHQILEGKNGSILSNPGDRNNGNSGKVSATSGQTLVFSNSARTLNFTSSPVPGSWPSPSIKSAGSTTNRPAGSPPGSLQQQKLLRLQQLRVLQQPQTTMTPQTKVSPSISLPSSVATKFPYNAPGFSHSLIQRDNSIQSPLLKNSGRMVASTVPMTSLHVASSTTIHKNSTQQKGSTSQGQTQISFGGDFRPTFAQMQEISTSTHSPSLLGTGSPSSSGKLRNNSTGSKTGSGGTLQSKQDESSSTGPGQKSSPVCGRNVPSILNTCPSHLSELKY